MKTKDYGCNTTFNDLLLNMLLAFVCLFILAFALMNQNKNENNITAKADYLITVSWPIDSDHDVDTYVEDPSGAIVYFRRREAGLVHLDRDDQGQRGDFFDTPAGPVSYDENREIVTLRGTMAGEYTLNVHMYRRATAHAELCPVSVQIDKLTPYSTVLRKTVELGPSGDEKTVTRFTLDENGVVTSMNDLPKAFVGAALGSPDIDSVNTPGGSSGP